MEAERLNQLAATIADLDTRVAQLYGMIHPGESATVTVRAVFLIDPKRTIRAIIYYPLNAGRNIDEILRITQALQTADSDACATPVNWTPGEKVVVPPPKTVRRWAAIRCSNSCAVVPRALLIANAGLTGSESAPPGSAASR